MLRIILIHFLIDYGRLDFIDAVIDVLAAPSVHLVKLEALLVDHPRHLLVETPERILYHVFGIRALNGLYKCNEFLF